MSSTNIPNPVSAPEFQSALLRLINEVLPTLRFSHMTWQPVDATTPLFEQGRIDSLAILHLIGAIEELTGRPVPDELVSMKHFRTVEAMTAAFCHPHHEP
jgi:acyl carrier protein